MLQKRTTGEYEAEDVDWVLIAMSVWWGTWQGGKRLDRHGPITGLCLAHFDRSIALFLASSCFGFHYSRRFHVIFMRRWDAL